MLNKDIVLWGADSGEGVTPSQPTRGSGEHRELPSRSQKRILCTP